MKDLFKNVMMGMVGFVVMMGMAGTGFCADESLVVTEDGNVGIGVLEPMAKLHVNDSIVVGTQIPSTSFNIGTFFCPEELFNQYVHIKLPYNVGQNDIRKMFYIKIRGYAYDNPPGREHSKKVGTPKPAIKI